ncbi:hypothetical protein TCAL_16841 [Tigriopus californicus]|uniref:Uncharacterized protein n=1 Tax=Tigriopus californicus TaxID=6832 RepID=A0A553PDY6_TIGCA|nr:uncharacterized protein LOC131892611 [Tigriopus californicus]TRY75893.1 hypothetical protein TCAL_16841 [Tigriopus californicus]
MVATASISVRLDDILNDETVIAIKKVPGEVQPVGRMSHEIRKFRSEISHKSVPELKDLLQRQNNILKNTKLLAKLPDKGAKVRDKKTVIEGLIEAKTKEVNDTADLLKNLSISGKAIDLEEIEWKYGGGLAGSLGAKPKNVFALPSTSSASETKVLQMLAEGPVPKAEKASDLDSEMDRHAMALSAKGDHTLAKPRFIPYNSLHNDHVADQDVHLKKRLTPRLNPGDLMPLPDVSNNKAQMVSLEESLKIQQIQGDKLKELQVARFIRSHPD